MRKHVSGRGERDEKRVVVPKWCVWAHARLTRDGQGTAARARAGINKKKTCDTGTPVRCGAHQPMPMYEVTCMATFMGPW